MSPPLDYLATLRSTCDDLAILLPGEEAEKAIALHLQELYRWNERINLTGIRSPEEGIRRHAAESLVALPFVQRAAAATPAERPAPLIADLGSGNGFPGLPLLLAVTETRGLLVESAGRKADFLRSVVRRTGCHDRVSVLETRLESEGQLPEPPDVFTVRAFPEPDRWITTLAREGRWILAWLARKDAERIARHPEVATRAVLEPLPTHRDSTLLVVTP
jgi:16S rRNA (guanine(527)-N(7))-methyltransferase RsmG